MRLFRMKAEPEGKNGLTAYLEHNYVAYGGPGIGDLSLLGEDELEERLAESPELLQPYLTFAYLMEDGDYVIVDDGERTYLGDLGDYYYLADYDTHEERSGHRRGVTWLRSLLREELHPDMQAFLGEAGEVGAYRNEVTKEQLERLLAKPVAAGIGFVDDATIREAIAILKEAMRSDDPERRERAAIAILRAARLEERG